MRYTDTEVVAGFALVCLLIALGVSLAWVVVYPLIVMMMAI